VANPRRVESIVSIEVIGATGTFSPKSDATLTVPPGSVANVSVRSIFDGEPLAIRVTAPRPITAAVRTVTGGDVAFATAVRPIRDSTTVAVPAVTGPGGSAQVVISSVGPKAEVDLAAFDGSGKTLLEKAVSVAEASSAAVPLPAGTRFVRLAAATPDAVAGFSFSDAAGVATAGVVPAIRSVLLPVVRPGW
jgi:hypothetical protein